MPSIVPVIREWTHHDEPCAIATVIDTWSSAPRPVGAMMVVDNAEQVRGSVSGGCVEGDVFQICQQVMAGGAPRIARYGVSDDTAFNVGLTCGGRIEVFIQQLDDALGQAFTQIADKVEAFEPIALVRVIGGQRSGQCELFTPDDSTDNPGGQLAGQTADSADQSEHVDQRAQVDQNEQGASLGLGADIEAQIVQMLSQGKDGTLYIETENGGHELLLVQSFAPPPRMMVFGAVDFSVALVKLGKFLGYHVTVCDARPVFATEQRFPEADEVVVMWPHKYLAQQRVDETTVICVLTHDPKFDVPLLQEALGLPARYIGMMGSRRTRQDRLDRLRDVGVGDDLIARLHSPIGLDLGGRSPEETALSIAAEVVATTYGGSGSPLRAIASPIHHETIHHETASHA